MWIIRCKVKHKNVCVFIFTDNSEDMLHLSEEGRRNVELLLVVVQLLSRVCLWPHGVQHGRLPCPLPSPGLRANSCPLSQWCHPTISSSLVPFPSCLQSFPASGKDDGSFPVNRLFTSGGQSIVASASASVFPMNIQGWFPLGLTGLISLQSTGFSRVFNTTVQKHQFFSTFPSLCPALTFVHDYWKDRSLDYMELCWQCCLCYLKHLFRFVIASCQEGFIF